MAIAKVGSAVTFNSNTSNITTSGQSLSITPTAGNALVVVAYMRGSTTTAVTVTATGGTATFNSQVAYLGNSTYLHMQTAANIGSGITSIKVTPNVGARGQIWLQEYSGVDTATPIDVTATSGTTGATTTLTGSSITPVTVGAIVISAFGNQQNTGSVSPAAYTTGGPTAHSGTKAGTSWASEYDLAAGTGSTTHNLVVASNGVDDTSGAYQADWTIASGFASPSGSIALRPVVTVADTQRFFALF